MCGRYLFYDENNEYLEYLISEASRILPAETFAAVAKKEVFPSQLCFAARYDSQKRKMLTDVMYWGYEGFRGSPVINARSETAFSSSFFSGSQPCVMPASGYYEWDADKHRFLFTCREQTMFLAGLCRTKNKRSQFVILTEDAPLPQSRIHVRQPVVFDRETAKAWCSSPEPMLFLKYSIQERRYTEG